MSAFWRLDVVPQIDEMVRQRIAPDAYQRYLKDPEREAFLQELRRHEIGGRRIEDVLDSITAEPLTGLRSIAAGCTAGQKKNRPRRGGRPRRGLSASPNGHRAESQAGRRCRMSGRLTSARSWPPGRRGGRSTRGASPPPEAGPLRDDWLRHAAQVESYREVAGITDPEQAIGPVPAGQPELGELFHGAVRALRLADEAALLKAMGQGEVEAIVDAHDQAVAFAPPDVQPRSTSAAGRLGRRAGTRRHRRRQPGRRGAGRPPKRRPSDAAAGPGPARRSRRGAPRVDRGARRPGGGRQERRRRASAPRPGRAPPAGRHGEW